jgi:hypothetical protein
MADIFGPDISDSDEEVGAGEGVDEEAEDADADEGRESRGESAFFYRHGQTQWPDNVNSEVAVKRLPRDSNRSERRHALTPEPNYSAFKAEYVDAKGREYSVARSGKHLMAQGDSVHNASYNGTPSRTASGEKVGRLLLNLRMPINQRWSVPLPDPWGEKLTLYHPATQVLCKATTDGVFVASPRGRTGHVFVSDFESLGQVDDPTPYEPRLRSGKPPGANRF